MSHKNDSVRNKLIEITDKGLMLKAIALNSGIDVNDLSRFKCGMDNLKRSDVEILSEYLNEVYIPQWKTVVKERPITARERVLASRNKQNGEKQKDRRREISFDLLRELD